MSGALSEIRHYVQDEARLGSLAAFAILDTPPEEGFDGIVELATQLCACPIALVSLVDSDRQWFKARVNFPSCETDLDSSVCAYALREPDVLVIPDLTADRRTAGNPLVTGDPFIRFYAGAPLRTPDGQTLGTLCVIDHMPRPKGLTASQRKGLVALAAQAMAQLELRRSFTAQQRVLRQHETLLRVQKGVAASRGDLDAILATLVDGAMDVVPQADGGVIEMRDGEELVYRCARGSIARHAGLRMPVQGSLAGRCLLSGKAMLCEDARQDARINAPLLETLGLRSCLIVPMFQDGAAAGVLKLQSGRPDAFNQADIRAAEVLAGAVTAGLAEYAFRKQSEILQTVTDHVARAVFLMDVEGRITFANPDAARMFGWEAHELAGARVHDRLHHSRPDGAPYPFDACPLMAALKAGADLRDLEEVFFRKDRTPVNVRATVAPVLVGGQVVSAVMTVSDVTQRRAEAARQEESRKLKEATQELGDRLRDAVEAAEIPAIAGDILGRALNLSHMGMGVVDDRAETVLVAGDWTAPGLATIDGLHQFRDYGSYIEDLQRGETVVIPDTAQDERTAATAPALATLGVRALVNLPLIERGRFVSLFYALAAEPRGWTKEEVAFLRNAGDRIRAAIARLEAEAQQRVLNEELSHRMKNTLAVVQGIAIQTLRGVTEKDVVLAFTNRIQAMASAHNVLMQEKWAAAHMRGVVKAVLENFGHGERFDTSGPDVKLGPRAVLSLSMVLHELATNATKYGSLSVDGGWVLVSWKVKPSASGQELIFNWRETGGPPAREPTRKGFGSRLIKMGLTGSDQVTLTYGQTGFKAEMRASLANAQAT